MIIAKKRPYLIHCHCILVKNKLSVRIGISSRPTRYFSDDQISPTIPIRDFRLLQKNKFSAKIVITLRDKIIQEKVLDTDQFGHLNYRFSFKNDDHIELESAKVNIYEVSSHPGFDLFLGTRASNTINPDVPVIISDFDKTLVDTKYKTTVELYHSLTSPLKAFPTVNETLSIMAPMLTKKYPFFIVSASPHFYENPIRHWLLSQQIKDSGIFLKDYRHFFSFQNTELFSKDMKVHGTFKLSQLLNLTYMLELPRKIILFGDNSETDPLIYCLLKYLLSTNFDIQSTWEKIKNLEAFKLTQFQDSKLLNRLHLIKSLTKKKNYTCEIEINIRMLKNRPQLELPMWLEEYKVQINTY